MGKIKFYTRSADQNQPASVYLRFTDNEGANFIVRTKFKMIPAYWNAKKQDFDEDILESGIISQDDAHDIKDKFTEVKDYILRASYKLTGPVTLNWVKDMVENYDKPAEVVEKESLMEYINRFIKDAKSGKRMAIVKGLPKPYAKETIRSIRGLETALELFHKEIKRTYDFDDISIKFYHEFVNFYYDRKCTPNYVGRLIQTLKTIMQKSFDEDKHTNQEYKKKTFQAMKVKVEKIYLTPEEIKKLAALDLSDNPHWNKIRNIFLVGVFTAQRYEDFSTINESNLYIEDGRKYIKIHGQEKTSEQAIIPVSGELDAILSSYGYNLPKSFQQDVNENIKKIAEKAGIDNDVYLAEYEGPKRVVNKYKKWEKISTHCCRRSGITNMLHSGIPPHQIMLVSGHQTEHEFWKYVKTSKMDNAKELAKHEYFSPLRVAQ